MWTESFRIALGAAAKDPAQGVRLSPWGKSAEARAAALRCGSSYERSKENGNRWIQVETNDLQIYICLFVYISCIVGLEPTTYNNTFTSKRAYREIAVATGQR